MKPKVDPSAHIMENTYISGNVEIGPNVFILPFCSIRGDIEPIIIGKGTNVQDGVIMHTAEGAPTIIGKNVSVGHGAIVHGATVEDDCIIGMNATVLNNAKIGAGSIVGANALVKENFECPENSLLVGVPAKVIRTDPKMRGYGKENAEEYHKLRKEYLSGEHEVH